MLPYGKPKTIHFYKRPSPHPRRHVPAPQPLENRGMLADP